MKVIHPLLLICLTLALAACVSLETGDDSEFDLNPDDIPEVGLGEGPIDDGSSRVGTPAIQYDPLLVRKLLDDFALATSEEREAISNDLVAMGKAVIPHLVRAQQRIKDQAILIELMRLNTRIQEADSGSGPVVEENGPNANNENAANGSEETPKNAGNGDVPASTADTIRSPDDLVDLGFSQEEVDNFIYNRLNAAKRAFEAGRFARSIELCKAILTLAPQSRYRVEVQQLMLDAQSGDVSDRRLAGTIGFDRKFENFADAKDGTLAKALKLNVFMTNVGSRDLSIDFGDGGEGNSSVLILEVELKEESITDSTTSRGRISVPMVGESVRLSPGESHKFSLDISDFSGLSPGGGAKQLISRVAAFGRLRPARFIVHLDEEREQRIFRPILLSSDNIVVMPAGFDLALAQRAPVAYIKANVEKLNLANLHMAYEFLKTENYGDALEYLLDTTLRTTGAREREARLSLAARISGRPFNLKVEDWIEWWQNNRFRYR